MKKFLFALMILVLAACAKELSITVEPRQPIHVTVGAGIGDANPQTRSQVEMNGTTRTLKFSEGDKLYVEGNIDATHLMAGELTLTSGRGTTSATFSGDLTVWETSDGLTYTADNSYVLQHPENPMLEYGSNPVTATLLQKNAMWGVISKSGLAGPMHYVSYEYCIVEGQTDNVSKLMETGIYVRGTYNSTTESFSLACGDPIFNCNFTTQGLAANTTYYVSVVKDGSKTSYYQQVLSDANGYVCFACTTGLSGSGDWSIQLSTSYFILDSDKAFIRPIGNKTLGAKVYNVGNYTAPAPGPDPDPATDIVLLSQVTSASVGNIVGSNGRVYPPDATMPDGVSKAAMICCVSSPGHGLAIELNSNPPEIFSSPFPCPANIDGGSWHTPSRDDWQNMVNGCRREDFIPMYNATGVTFKATYEEAFRECAYLYWTSDTYYYVDTVHNATTGIYRYYIFFDFETLRIGSRWEGLYDDGFYHLACLEF